jgi:hypothetical protein
MRKGFYGSSSCGYILVDPLVECHPSKCARDWRPTQRDDGTTKPMGVAAIRSRERHAVRAQGIGDLRSVMTAPRSQREHTAIRSRMRQTVRAQGIGGVRSSHTCRAIFPRRGHAVAVWSPPNSSPRQVGPERGSAEPRKARSA